MEIGLHTSFTGRTRYFTIGPFIRKKNKPRLTSLTRELNRLYERGLYKMRSVRINGSQLIRDQCVAFVLVVIAIAELREFSGDCGKILSLRSVSSRLT